MSFWFHARQHFAILIVTTEESGVFYFANYNEYMTFSLYIYLPSCLMDISKANYQFSIFSEKEHI